MNIRHLAVYWLANEIIVDCGYNLANKSLLHYCTIDILVLIDNHINNTTTRTI